MEPPNFSFKSMPCIGSLFRNTKVGYHGDTFGIIVMYQSVSANTHNLVLRKPDVTCSELLFADVEHVLRFFVDVAKKKNHIVAKKMRVESNYLIRTRSG